MATCNVQSRTIDTPKLPRVDCQSTRAPARFTGEVVIDKPLSIGSTPSVQPPGSFHSSISRTSPISFFYTPNRSFPVHPLPTRQPPRSTEADFGDSLTGNRNLEEDNGIKDSKASMCSSHLAQLFDRSANSIHLLRGKEAAELGSKLYSVRSSHSSQKT